jgi:lipopolysaccharide/colanic/teichoic acid biosynthesis glycosyltransferase
VENSVGLSISSIQKHMWLSDIIKRLFDIVVSLMVLVVLAPLYGLVAIAIKRETLGPVFYRGLRVGRGRKYFKILKFRTMYETAESYSGPKVTAQDDPRVTPLGHWLRDTKLNEFPQFWNVLKGEMSLVGPRPEDPALAKTWPWEAAEELSTVRPGITSPASVLYRNEESLLNIKDVLQKYLHELTPDKMRLDQLYVRYRSFWLDLDVIFWTALLLIPKIKAYSPPEQLLYVGPITRLVQRYMSWFIWDFLVAFVSITLAGAFFRMIGPLNLGWQRAFLMAIRYSMLYIFVGALLGVNRINWSKAVSWDAIRLSIGWIISTFLALIIHYFVGYTSLRHYGLVLAASILSLSGFVFGRYRSHLIIGLLGRLARSKLNTMATRERVLVVGSGRTAEHIAWLLDHPTYSSKFQVVGFVDDDLFSQGLNIYGTKVLGSYQDVPELIKKYDIGIILLADNRIPRGEFKSLTDITAKTATKFVVVPDVFGALKNLVVVPPFHTNNAKDEIDKNSPCSYCIGRYSRLEMECQIEELDTDKQGE